MFREYKWCQKLLTNFLAVDNNDLRGDEAGKGQCARKEHGTGEGGHLRRHGLAAKDLQVETSDRRER